MPRAERVHVVDRWLSALRLARTARDRMNIAPVAAKSKRALQEALEAAAAKPPALDAALVAIAGEIMASVAAERLSIAR